MYVRVCVYICTHMYACVCTGHAILPCVVVCFWNHHILSSHNPEGGREREREKRDKVKHG